MKIKDCTVQRAYNLYGLQVLDPPYLTGKLSADGSAIERDDTDHVMGERGGEDYSVPGDVLHLVSSIHSSPCMAVLNVTGAGSLALSWLLSVPGASATLLEAAVPYSPTSFSSLLQGRSLPSSLASSAAAAALASAAYATAVRTAPRNTPRLIGVGAASAIKTGRALQGKHRAHVCIRSDEVEISYYASFAKGAGRTRLQEEALTSRLILQALADACQDPLPAMSAHPMSLLREYLAHEDDVLDQPLLRERVDVVDALVASASGSELDCPLPVAQMEPSGAWRLGAVSVSALLPGSFNPVHVGHRNLLEAARTFLPADSVVGYELSVCNPDKPTLSADEVRKRATQFRSSVGGSSPLVLTKEALFVGKAALLPGTTFIVGYDTAVRIVNPQYYGGETPMLEALGEILRNGCSFLVAGRRETPDSGNFLTFRPSDAPPGFSNLFRSIPESLFREDISSTQLREMAQGNHPL